MATLGEEIAGLFKNSYTLIQTYFYEFLGNFIPGSILVLYFSYSIFWRGPIGLPDDILSRGDATLTVLAAILVAFLVGEGLYSLTSRLVVISRDYVPDRNLARRCAGRALAAGTVVLVLGYLTTLMPTLFGVLSISAGMVFFTIGARQKPPKQSERIWWLMPDKPTLSLAEFSRYFFTMIDVNRRQLAGKFGWLVFYANSSVMFLIIGIAEFVRTGWNPPTTGLLSIASYSIFLLATVLGSREWGPVLWDAKADSDLQQLIEVDTGPVESYFNLDPKFEDKGAQYIINTLRRCDTAAKAAVAGLLFSKAEEFQARLRDLSKQQKQERRGLSEEELRELAKQQENKIQELSEKDLEDARRAYWMGNFELAADKSLVMLKAAAEHVKPADLKHVLGEFAPNADSDDPLFDNLYSFLRSLHYYQFTIRKDATRERLKIELKERDWVNKPDSEDKSEEETKEEKNGKKEKEDTD